MPKELEKSFTDLLETIQKSKNYQEYLQLEKKLKQNEEICALIKEIKDIQKRLVKEEYAKKDTTDLEDEYKKMLEQLDTYPIYVSFIEKQKEINEIFQIIKQKIEKTFDEMIIKNS